MGKFLSTLLHFSDKLCADFITPAIYEFSKEYADNILRSLFYRMLIKAILVVAILIPLLLLYKYGRVSDDLALLIFSFSYIIFLIDFFLRAILNICFYSRLLRYRSKFIVYELHRIKPLWMKFIHSFYVRRGVLPSDNQISNVIINHIKKRLLLLAIFFAGYIILYRILVAQFIPLMGKEICLYEQPVIAFKILLTAVK